MIGHSAQSLPGKPEAPVRISSSMLDESNASIQLEWFSVIETGGVPLSGFKLYS